MSFGLQLIILQTENNMKTTDHEDLSDNMVMEEMESLVEDNAKSCISLTRNMQKHDENVVVPISKAAISVPSTAVDMKNLVEEAKETKLKLQQANKIINKLDKSKRILMKRIKRLIYEKKQLSIENQLLKQTRNLRKIFNNDQFKAVNLRSIRGHKWSNNTITKALRFKLSCGSSGYQEILNQGIPLPSERTLRRRLEGIDFKPGICDKIFDMIKQQVSQMMDDREKDCMLAIDEMSIMAGEQIDQSTMSHVGLSTLPDTFGNYNVSNHMI